MDESGHFGAPLIQGAFEAPEGTVGRGAGPDVGGPVVGEEENDGVLVQLFLFQLFNYLEVRQLCESHFSRNLTD